MAERLTPEQKERLIQEFAHHISVGCYDFVIEVGGVVVESNEFPPAQAGSDGEEVRKGCEQEKSRFGWMALK